MQYLLDVNVLVAWGWSDHSEHRRAAGWVKSMREQQVMLLTSAIPELGFVRVSVQRTGGRLSVGEAAEVLTGMLESLGKCHGFLADNQTSASDWPDWCRSASETTDAHLMSLVSRNEISLATLDEGIPGAFLIPMA